MRLIYLADTNVLLRMVFRKDPGNPVVLHAMHKLRRQGHELRSLPQNFAEFWNVCTRPVANNGYGRSPAVTSKLLRIVERLALPLPDTTNAYANWRRLVNQYGVVGVQVHDARIAASMLAHGITHLLTFNTADFGRYASEGIVAVDPGGVT